MPQDFGSTLDDPRDSSQGDPSAVDRQTRQWATVLHLSQFAGYVAPIAGFLAPIVIWIVKKDESPEIDAHGREVLNWLISLVIYFVVSGLLCMVLIGIPLVMILGVLAVVFPIIAAVKASDGVLWRYPLTMRFF